MAGSAPYELNLNGSDDETFVFSVPFENQDGSAFPFEDYAIEYSIGRGWYGRTLLTQDEGISIIAPDVTFRVPSKHLCKGVYQHGCRIRHLATGDEFQIFDGTVTISEGGFR